MGEIVTEDNPPKPMSAVIVCSSAPGTIVLSCKIYPADNLPLNPAEAGESEPQRFCDVAESFPFNISFTTICYFRQNVELMHGDDGIRPAVLMHKLDIVHI